MKKEVIIIILLSIFFISNHLHDVGDIVYKRNYYCEVGYDNKIYLGNKEVSLINGFFEVNANQLYHISWYISYVCFFMLTLIALKKEGKK